MYVNIIVMCIFVNIELCNENFINILYEILKLFVNLNKNVFYWKIVNIIKSYRYFLELIYKVIVVVLNIF